MSTSKAFCFIPAKAASTRLKRKNLLQLNGKELIGYAVENALNCGIFDKEDVIVSTESEEVADVAKRFGANVPYLRDEKLARDPYGVADVALDFLKQFPDYTDYDHMVIVLPTAPFMVPQDLIDGYEQFLSGGYKALMAVTATNHNAFRSVKIEQGQIKPVFPEHIKKKSQELDPTYRINGAMAIVKIDHFIKEQTYFMEPLGAYEMPWERSVDIDTEEDFRLATFFTQK